MHPKKKLSRLPQATSTVGDFENTETKGWNKLLRHPLVNKTLRDSEAAIIFEFDALPAARVEFWLDTTLNYDAIMPKSLKELYPHSEWDKSNFCFRLEQVDRQTSDPDLYDFRIKLSLTPNTRYLWIHSDKNYPNRNPVLIECFQNAVTFLKNGQRPLLPTPFEIQMAWVSNDNKLILRREKKSLLNRTPKKGWGATYRHSRIIEYYFERCQCRISMDNYFRMCQYDRLKLSDCKFYGFAIERENLSPTLIAVCNSKESVKTILQDVVKREYPANDGYATKAINLNPTCLANHLKRLDPISRFAATYALLSTAQSKNQRWEFLQQLSQAHSQPERFTPKSLNGGLRPISIGMK